MLHPILHAACGATTFVGVIVHAMAQNPHGLAVNLTLFVFFMSLYVIEYVLNEFAVILDETFPEPEPDGYTPEFVVRDEAALFDADETARLIDEAYPKGTH